MHKHDAITAWRMDQQGETAWAPKTVPAKGAAAQGMANLGIK